ncbi:MAG TPA: metallophosphoesterase [Bacteroidota bacterium]|nr:metallophosphoesterase [Bacteroidota bacterium]
MTRTQEFFVFISVALLIYVLLNFYVYIRGRETLPEQWRTFYTIVFWLLASTFIVGNILERSVPSRISTAFIWVGSFWLGALAYSVILLLLIDCIRLIFAALPFLPRISISKSVLGIVVFSIVLVAVIASRINALNPVVKNLDISIDKHAPMDQLTIAAVSDIHLGTLVCNSHFEKIVDRINGLQPDIILLVGDVVDEDIEPVIRNNLGETLKRLHAPYGVYACTGNHEYIGGVERACKYLEEHDIRMLRDSVATVAGGLVIVGREDVMSRGMLGRDRKPLAELLRSVPKEMPILVMDHQPVTLGEAAAAGVDVQLSGHTHNGQLFPLNYIASAIYEVSWGYKKKDSTHIYVSCGVGTWGPPMRSGNRPEIAKLTLHFSGKEGTK